MDTISAEKRSWNMSRIPGKDTSIEVLVRKYLFHHGFRYRKNVSKLPGKPDIVLQKYKTAIFVNGCFWHHHKDCKLAYTPKTNIDFWNAKFESNKRNDQKKICQLEQMGYKVLQIWECEINDRFEHRMEEIIKQIQENCRSL